MNERAIQKPKTQILKGVSSLSKIRKSELSHSINSPADRILFLQRTAGNQAVQRMLQRAKLEKPAPEKPKPETEKAAPEKATPATSAPAKGPEKAKPALVPKQKFSHPIVQKKAARAETSRLMAKAPAAKGGSTGRAIAFHAAKKSSPTQAKGERTSDEVMKNFEQADASKIAATFPLMGEKLNKGLNDDRKAAAKEIPPLQAQTEGVSKSLEVVSPAPPHAPAAKISKGSQGSKHSPQIVKPYQDLAPLAKNADLVKNVPQTPESLTGALASIDTQDLGLNTSAGERPQFEATGDADPELVARQSEEGKSQIQQQQSIITEQISNHPGTELIQPVCMDEQARVAIPLSAGGISTKAPSDMANYAALPIPANVRQAADAQLAPLLKKSMAGPNAEIAKATARRDKEKEAAIENTRQQAQELCGQAQQEQEAVVQKSRQKVSQEQKKGLEESQKRLESFNAESSEKQASTTKDVNQRIESDQKQSDEHLASAELRAEAERKKSEEEAAAKKGELEKKSEDQGWWSKAVSAIKSVVDSVTKAIDSIFNALRSLVKGIIEAARKFAVGLIEAGRKWVVSKLEAFGSWLKEKVNKYLKDFPALAARINAAIDNTVNEATRVVNAVANKLKAGVNALADALGKVIDSVLSAFQGVLKFAVALYGAVLTGDFAAAAKMVFLAACQVLGIPAEKLMEILNKAGSAISIIFKDPIGFLKNLFAALGKGFNQFASNILTHLINGLMGWLFGALEEAGIKVPTEFTFKAIFGLVMEILGITYARIRVKVVKLIGEKNVTYIEKVLSVISTLIAEGPAGLWEHIKEYLGNLKDTILDGIKDWVITKIVKTAIIKLVSMSNPVGAIVEAVLAIYNTVMFFIERIKQIISLVEAIVNSIYKIAVGNIGDAANWVENAMARTLPVIISFLARLINLGGISEKIKEVIEGIRARVDMALDKVINFIAKKAKLALAKGKEVVGKIFEWWKEKKEFKLGKEKHYVLFHGEGKSAEIFVETTPLILEKFIATLKPKTNEEIDAVDIIKAKKKEIDDLKEQKEGSFGEKDGEKIREALTQIADQLAILGPGPVPPTKVVWENKKLKGDVVGSSMVASPLSINPGSLAGSKPYEESALWNAVNRRKNTYVRGHLLNHHVHGPGINKNLVPITKSLNANMEKMFESDIKRVVLGENKVIEYSVRANFDQPARKYLKEESLLPDYLYFSAIELEYNKKKRKWETSNKLIFNDKLPNILPDDTDADIEYKPVNLSTDTAKHIEENIPDIGHILAARIVKLRPFRTYKELAEAKEIGDKTVTMLKNKKHVRLY